MQEGISVNEACANNVIGTKEDFERSCNPDGTVKDSADTTTLSLKNSDTTVTFNNSYLQIGGGVAATLCLILIILIAVRMRRKKHA